jgi:hypothetical protein
MPCYFTVTLNLSVILPDLAYSPTATHNLFGCTGPPLAMCVFASTGRLLQGPINSLQLLPTNGPGLAVARWRIKSRSDDLRVEIFQEALVEPGLLEAIVLSVVLLQSGRSFGDTPDANNFSNPRFFSQAGCLNAR